MGFVLLWILILDEGQQWVTKSYANFGRLYIEELRIRYKKEIWTFINAKRGNKENKTLYCVIIVDKGCRDRFLTVIT